MEITTWHIAGTLIALVVGTLFDGWSCGLIFGLAVFLSIALVFAVYRSV
jgi:hypothetical protein